ncbi:MAG: 3-methylcrotonyl-CoA carboxylase, partial [Gammaproteobacteria bacterium]|nr:3-methylcrotonyl-CoA carboxylase [Gammaproteobacteria bacterium]
AEDPDNDFLPDIGTLKDLFEPHHLPGVRVDSGVEDGQTITPWYDPMLAKVIAYGTSRGQALARLRDALNHYRARGLRLNVGYLQRILHHPAFAEADLTTHFIAHHQAALAQKPFTASGQLALSWLGHFLHVHARGDDPWACADGWRLGDPDMQRCEIELNGTRHALRYRLAGTAQADVWVDEHNHVLTWQAAQARVWLDGQALPLYALGDATALTLFVRGESWTVRINPSDAGAQGQAQEDALVAPMHGRVTAILCHAGDKVAAGTPLLVMEAMKMEHTLRAPADGTVVAVLCDLYQNVPAAQPLIEFEAGGAVVTGE